MDVTCYFYPGETAGLFTGINWRVNADSSRKLSSCNRKQISPHSTVKNLGASDWGMELIFTKDSSLLEWSIVPATARQHIKIILCPLGSSLCTALLLQAALMHEVFFSNCLVQQLLYNPHQMLSYPGIAIFSLHTLRPILEVIYSKPVVWVKRVPALW